MKMIKCKKCGELMEENKSKICKLCNAFSFKKEKIKTRCPRRDHFCDGTPNPIPSGEYESIGQCKHWQNGKCMLMDNTYFHKYQISVFSVSDK